ncbi:ABC transporter [Mucilaginibacter sp. PAMC 26640]|nr:ABC transporter [Mucilaginibacter sp. PAMC 26640]
MPKAIKVENLSKAYQLGTFGTGTISHDLERYWARMRGKEDPFLKIGEENDRTTIGTGNMVWSLRDINFEIEQGDAVGIIGRNGAGKSTLLKILSRTTTPTTGKVRMKGRVASLLEVGTGFHPELSGRENIYLNGAVLGMRKAEIKRKFDEIVDFSGVQRYIDTPVKRYSSGMYVRLAFAVAAHLESEILIVDEVLAVGDAEFQKKCMGKMGDISKGEGRTVLFVSHNMAAIQNLCKSAILLSNGKLNIIGDTSKVINAYLNGKTNAIAEYVFKEQNANGIGYATKLSILDVKDNYVSEIFIGQSWKIQLHFKILKQVSGLVVALGMINSHDISIRTSWSKPNEYQEGDYVATFVEDKIHFTTGKYKLVVGISIGKHSVQYIDEEIYMNISDLVEQIDETVMANNGIIFNQMEIDIKPATNF